MNESKSSRGVGGASSASEEVTLAGSVAHGYDVPDVVVDTTRPFVTSQQ